MNSSNRFSIETLARQHQAEIENQLRRSTRFGDAPRPAPAAVEIGTTLRTALVAAATAGLGLLLGTGMTLGLVFAFTVLR